MLFATKKIRLLRWGVLGVLLGLLTACGDPPVPPPAEIISKAVPAASALTSMHFTLGTNKLAKYPKGLFLTSADGDVVRPDKLRATAKALIAGAAIEIQVAGVGN
ncbi:MAG TPA: LppX_LprAFG lipoprotein, partial [Chloroflexia bacterium]|nr:LppX_LprAFG lipoprotein [Chloroflexia bacterium]